MPNSSGDPNSAEPPAVYTIRIQGRLDERWSEWFEGLAIITDESGNTLLTGPVADQSALYGLLRRVRDLGMPLISVEQLDPGRSGSYGGASAT